MSATKPDPTLAPRPVSSTAQVSAEQPAWLRWLNPNVCGGALCLAVAAIATCAMGSVVESIFSKKQRDKDANVADATMSTGGGGGGSALDSWWNPATAPIEASSTGSGSTGGQSSSSDSSYQSGGSVIPIDRGIGFSSGSLIVGNQTPIGANPSKEAYSILGLGMRSFSGGVGLSPSLTMSSLGISELHFSLGGDSNLVPVDNLSTSGSGVMTPAVVPEPSTAGLLAAAVAGMAFRRRRKPVTAA